MLLENFTTKQKRCNGKKDTGKEGVGWGEKKGGEWVSEVSGIAFGELFEIDELGFQVKEGKKKNEI